jgi:hypothetical protein
MSLGKKSYTELINGLYGVRQNKLLINYLLNLSDEIHPVINVLAAKNKNLRIYLILSLIVSFYN